eukprot:SAG11_NODE_30888_length_296_cov_1.583756_1_plen_23_part_10
MLGEIVGVSDLRAPRAGVGEGD